MVRIFMDRHDAVPEELAQEAFGISAAVPKVAKAVMRMTTRAGQQWFTLLLCASTYLEWGSGGSTVLAAWRAVQEGKPLYMVSVDSSEAWIRQLRSKHPVLVEAEAAGKLAFRAADTGAVGAWGHPVYWNSRTPALQRSQATAYVEMANASQCCFNLVLVDGRFRVACMLHALRLAHERTVVLVHDSPRYLLHPAVQRYYQVAFQIGELAALRPREGAIEEAKLGGATWLALYNQVLVRVQR